MKLLKEWVKKIKRIKRQHLVSSAVILLCGLCVILFLNDYFHSWGQPYMMEKITDLSEGWEYETPGTARQTLSTLQSGPKLAGGETMTMYRVLDTALENAAVLIRANHQTVTVYLGDTPLYIDKVLLPAENPGMALHFILLPADYLNKTLRVELTSPYAAYSGRTSPVMLGTIPSLEAWALSLSMRPLIFMSMCLLLGLCIITLTLAQALGGDVRWQNLALGVFAVIWALYYVCTEYIVFQFFPPAAVSALSLGLYYTFAVPLTLYFYSSFERYKKWMLPPVILHGGFAAAALLLQVTGLVDLPRLLHVNNILLSGLAYTVVLTVLEAFKGNRLMVLSAPFLAMAYGSMLYNFNVFYTRHGVVPYSYRDTYFLLILAVLVYNIVLFFNRYFKEQRKNELLALQNRQARESYKRLTAHLKEVGGLKHEMRHHFTALQSYLDAGRNAEAERYLKQYAGQSSAVTDAVHHDNFIISAVASGLLRDGENRGVEVELDLKANPFHIAEPDLYSLLTNIAENALEACTSLPEGQRRFIALTISRREPYLAITCQNSRAGEIIPSGDGFLSGKREDGHGYGLWVIQRIAETYDGLINTQYDETTFTLTVVLKDRR
ncbi:sensor histidine kinase [Kineothrix alysoides]|nr:sensor histidine kinase [Kineothrix alysoides]